ncbi:hypothetical protein Hypma_003832 [Hypsizygus marmoreus]|uniref:Uncharacterized protein n=1 Tax=Hypsizygus marmoreus TaxID=39966 RepID=A0A369K1Y8_HYPMA|nr:hypothetical protein Hypma_003832 [Hypsizygus marmoreus]
MAFGCKSAGGCSGKTLYDNWPNIVCGAGRGHLGKTGLPLQPKYRILVVGMSTEMTGNIAERVEIAVGMKVMVLLNIATEADVANGTRGKVVDVVLHSRATTCHYSSLCIRRLQISSQTIERVIIGIGKPLTRDRRLSAYTSPFPEVEVEIRSGFCDFDERLFTTHPSEDL